MVECVFPVQYVPGCDPVFTQDRTYRREDSRGAQAMPDASLRHENIDLPVDVKTAARYLGVSPSLVYAYVERKQIPHYRMMGRAIRFRLSELEKWRQQFHVNGGINE